MQQQAQQQPMYQQPMYQPQFQQPMYGGMGGFGYHQPMGPMYGGMGGFPGGMPDARYFSTTSQDMMGNRGGPQQSAEQMLQSIGGLSGLAALLRGRQ